MFERDRTPHCGQKTEQHFLDFLQQLINYLPEK